ncbi:hypothetical protein B0T25DRAFT_99408 [Lasiosphaeria hispida]|uniref:Cyanovirin-N domain-containing protein n=1 Tax=Lasiosphaeria hispida TaxID=260671 RepID=A0AAJ0HQI6_9PEZI|nr:hypothetical protein B0T25DRAFT_99408 [Lasiosphaeria hispida]
MQLYQPLSFLLLAILSTVPAVAGGGFMDVCEPQTIQGRTDGTTMWLDAQCTTKINSIHCPSLDLNTCYQNVNAALSIKPSASAMNKGRFFETCSNCTINVQSTAPKAAFLNCACIDNSRKNSAQASIDLSKLYHSFLPRSLQVLIHGSDIGVQSEDGGLACGAWNGILRDSCATSTCTSGQC